jgi:20S proteasome alpha/beta subunit
VSRILLESLGLDLATFNQNPLKFPPALQQKVYDKMGNAKLNVSFIVCGYDQDQPKIYMVGEYGIYSTAHFVGYTAIGIGEPHAANFFMVNGYKFNTPLKEAIYFAYRAKKSAEMAGGVGNCTDIYVLEKGKKAVSYRDGGKIIKRLDKIYDAHNGKIKDLFEKETVPELNKLDMEERDEHS